MTPRHRPLNGETPRALDRVLAQNHRPARPFGNRPRDWLGILVFITIACASAHLMLWPLYRWLTP